jgi:hypothetical protein
VRTFPYASVTVPYKIIDLDKINAVSLYKDLLKFYVAFTCDIPGSDTNLLKFYTLTLNVTENGTYPYRSVPISMSGYTFSKNTFKVTRLEPIKESKLMLAISEEFGIYIFNLTAIFSVDIHSLDQQLIGELNVFEKINFKEQIAETVDKSFKIVSFSLNLPSQVFCVTNFGIMMFEFPVDLRNTTEIIQSLPGSLIPKSRRQI